VLDSGGGCVDTSDDDNRLAPDVGSCLCVHPDAVKEGFGGLC